MKVLSEKLLLEGPDILLLKGPGNQLNSPIPKIIFNVSINIAQRVT